MATSLPPVSVPANIWIDLYAATGIAGGTKIIIQNTGSRRGVLTESSTEPPIPPGLTGVNVIDPRDFFTNLAANVGAWAFSKTGTTLQVEVAP